MQHTVLETEYWTVTLSHDQTYLGRCYAILKRPCGDLSEITTEELIDFHSIVKQMHIAAKKAFGAEMFNWSCLMNNAYQEKQPEPQVHWHFRPRYRNEVSFSGEKFIDPNFGHHYTPGALTEHAHSVDDSMMNAIIKQYKMFL